VVTSDRCSDQGRVCDDHHHQGARRCLSWCRSLDEARGGPFPMTTTAIDRPLRLAGAPAGSWAFGVRILLAVLVSLPASLWLQREVRSRAAVTVAILAEPTRGRALEKAFFRLIATVIGVTAAIVIVALFSQARDLLLAAFAGWIGLCVYAAGLLDGNRAYAAVLSGYSVGIIAIQQIDAPDQVFLSGMERGAAI